MFPSQPRVHSRDIGQQPARTQPDHHEIAGASSNNLFVWICLSSIGDGMSRRKPGPLFSATQRFPSLPRNNKCVEQIQHNEDYKAKNTNKKNMSAAYIILCFSTGVYLVKPSLSELNRSQPGVFPAIGQPSARNLPGHCASANACN